MKFPWIPHGLVSCLVAIIAVFAFVQHLAGIARPVQLSDRRIRRAAGQMFEPRRASLASRIQPRPFLAQRDDSGEQEWMDLPGQDPDQLSSMFTDLQRVNRWLGGTWMTGRALTRIARDLPASRPVTILDVASGSGDIPRVMSRWARRHERPVTVVATDINPAVLKLTNERDGVERVNLVASDALRLPFADDAVDIAACSFFLHHLDPPEAVAALREMRRVARGTVLINDMVRGWPSFAGAWVFSRIFTRNPISRHDAPLSARRSYSRAELLDLATAAGLTATATYGFVGYRVVLVTQDRRMNVLTNRPPRSRPLTTVAT